jgi:hypothetical protein
MRKPNRACNTKTDPKTTARDCFPKFVEPCLPTLTQVISGAPDWLHEIKYETNDMIEQHNLLNRAAALFDDGVLRHTMKEDFGPINGTNLRRAHVHQEKAAALTMIFARRLRLPFEDFVIHDIRRTCRTRFSALPVEDIVRELLLAHARPGLHKVYDLHA